MNGWTFPPRRTPAELAQQRALLEPQKDQLVKNQHVVSRAVLKNFSFKDANGGDALIPFNAQTKRELRPLGIGGCGKIVHLIRYASQSLEIRWKSTVEDHLNQLSASIRDRSILRNSDMISVVKDCIALHLVRSPWYLKNHAQWVVEAQQNIKPELVSRFKGQLTRIFLAKYGLYPAGDEALECVVDEFLMRWRQDNSDGLMERQDMEQTFDRIRGSFAPHQINVMFAPPGKEFLVSDSPAFTFLFDGTGQRFAAIRQAVGDSHGAGMPIARDCFVSTASDLKMGEAPPDFVDYLNTVQLEIAHEHVYYQQGSPLASFVSSALDS